MLTLLYLASFGFSLLTLFTSIVTVSLHSVKAPEGLMSEKRFLQAFFSSDVDSNGALDRDELALAITKLGLTLAQRGKLRGMLNAQMSKAGADRDVTFPVWFDVVTQMRDANCFASHHSPFIELVLRGPMLRHRKVRSEFVAQRSAALEHKLGAAARRAGGAGAGAGAGERDGNRGEGGGNEEADGRDETADAGAAAETAGPGGDGGNEEGD